MVDLDELCDQLFDAFVAHDLDAVESMLGEQAVITQNGRAMTWTEARVMLAPVTDVVRNHRS